MLNKNLNSKLETIDLEDTDIINRAQKSISCVRDALNELKTFTLEYLFPDEENEIHFFKKVKPEIFSKLIYYVKLNNIESKRPMGSFEIQQNYLIRELEKNSLCISTLTLNFIVIIE